MLQVILQISFWILTTPGLWSQLPLLGPCVGAQNPGSRWLGSSCQLGLSPLSIHPCPVLFSPHSRQGLSPVLGWRSHSSGRGDLCRCTCGCRGRHLPWTCPPLPSLLSPTDFPVLPAPPSLSLGFLVLTIHTAFFLLILSLSLHKNEEVSCWGLTVWLPAGCSHLPFRFWRLPGPGGLRDSAAWYQRPCLAGEGSKDHTWAEIHEQKSDHPKVPFLTFPYLSLGPPLSRWGNQEDLAGRDKVSSRKDFGFFHHGLSVPEQNSTHRSNFAVIACVDMDIVGDTESVHGH